MQNLIKQINLLNLNEKFSNYKKLTFKSWYKKLFKWKKNLSLR